MKKLIAIIGAVLIAVPALLEPVAAQEAATQITQKKAGGPTANLAAQKKITIRATGITIGEAFAQIEKQAGCSIAYGTSKLDTKRKITLSLDGASIDEAMTEVLRSTNLTYKLNGYHIILVEKPKESTPAPIPAKRNFTVSGRVTDAATGEVIIGCVVFDRIRSRGATTNAYGFYSLTLPAGKVALRSAYLGYEAFEGEFDLSKDTTLDITLDVAATSIEQVVVVAGDTNPLTSQVGATNVPIARIRNNPALMGESDLMKSLQYIPGVQGGAEGKADLSVRGGSPDQNLILLDGNPIYNANHLFGFVSGFNTDALKNVTLYKSGFPARFGGRLSSVIDINTNDGDKQHFCGSATLGLLAAKFNVEGPIIKDRTSFTLSGRRTWADAFMGSLQKDDSRTTLFFHDFNAKVHHRISDKTSVYLAAYHGRDRLKTTSTENYPDPGDNPGGGGYYSGGGQDRWIRSSTWGQQWRWGNTVASARLNSALSGNLFLNANLSFNRYHYNTSISDSYTYASTSGKTDRASTRIDYRSGIRDYTATLEFEYIPASNHYIRTGVQGVYHDFRPEALTMRGEQSVNVTGGKIPAGEFSIYAEDEWDVTRRLALNIGMRASAFRVHGTTYTGLDPRLSARLRVSDRVSVKAAYTRMQQYIHLLSSNSMLFQTDLWVPTTGRIKPMNSTQYSLGAYIAFPRLFDLSVEGYYKDMENVIEYKDGASFSGESSGWEEKVEAGIGRAYGIEVSLERRIGTTTGSLSYAWSKSERRFDEINFGHWFPAKYDRRHSVNFTVTQRLNKKIDLTVSWTYASGEMMTIPMMGTAGPKMSVADADDWKQSWNENLLLDGRNNYRAPAYHRLDVGMNFHPRKWRSPERYGEWNFGIYNLYNRMNAFGVYVDTGRAANNFKPQLKKMVLFPILPSVSYTYNF